MTEWKLLITKKLRLRAEGFKWRQRLKVAASAMHDPIVYYVKGFSVSNKLSRIRFPLSDRATLFHKLCLKMFWTIGIKRQRRLYQAAVFYTCDETSFEKWGSRDGTNDDRELREENVQTNFVFFPLLILPNESLFKTQNPPFLLHVKWRAVIFTWTN